MPGLGAYTSGYIPVRKLDSKRSTLSTSRQTAVISVQQPFQVTNAKMIEVFMTALALCIGQKQHGVELHHSRASG
jgi:hypothetical protein